MQCSIFYHNIYNFLQHLFVSCCQSVDNIQISKEADRQWALRKFTNRNTVYIGHSREAWSILSQHRILEWLNKSGSTYVLQTKTVFQKLRIKKTIFYFRTRWQSNVKTHNMVFSRCGSLSNLQIHRLHVLCLWDFVCLFIPVWVSLQKKIISVSLSYLYLLSSNGFPEVSKCPC